MTTSNEENTESDFESEDQKMSEEETEKEKKPGDETDKGKKPGDETEKDTKKKQKKKNKSKKRKLDESLDLEGSFTGSEINTMSEAVSGVCNVIDKLYKEIAEYPKCKTEIKQKMDELYDMSEKMLKNAVLTKLEEGKNKAKVNTVNISDTFTEERSDIATEKRSETKETMTEGTPCKKYYCDRCKVVIENEKEEKEEIRVQIEKGLNLTEEEFSTLVEKKWPQDVFTKTKLVTGNPLQTKMENLILFYENIDEDTTLMKMMKDKYPEINEAVQEVNEGESEEEGTLPFIENSVKTRKGINTKRIYLSKVEDVNSTRDVLSKFKTELESKGRNYFASAVSQAKWRKQIRKSLEVCFPKGEEEIEFFVPRGETETERAPREKEEALVLSTNVATYADTMRNIRAVLNPGDVGVNVKSVKTTKDKKVVIVTEKGEADTLKKEIESRFKNIETKVAGRGTANTSIVILDVDASMNGKEIEYFIKQTTKVHETEVKHLRLGRNGTQIATVVMPSETAEHLLREGEIRINWTMCRVKPKVNVMMCYNCLRPGHHSDICKEEKTDRKCLNCTRTGHLNKDCTNKSFCATCNREGHRTESTICPTHKRRVQDTTDNLLKGLRKEETATENEEMDVVENATEEVIQTQQ